MARFITLFSLILLSLFTYMKILNVKRPGLVKTAAGVAFAGLLSYAVYLLRGFFPYTRFAVMLIVMGAFAGFVTKTRFDLACVGITISAGINYGVFFVFLTLSATVLFLFTRTENNSFVLVTALIAQAFVIAALFRIKRLKSGILFLQEKGAGAPGLVISGVILLTVIMIDNNYYPDTVMDWLFVCLFFFLAGLFAWWRRGLTRLYREKINERNMLEYEKIIAEKDERIKKLQESNDFMAKLIHRDNKLLPAMYEAVKLLSGDAGHTAGLRQRQVMAHIDGLMRERSGAITKNQRENKVLPTTRDSLIDGVMAHMLARASEEDIEFDITVIGDISGLTATAIPAVKFQTLCADLIENAIIAASYSEYKKIMITVGRDDGVYELTVKDTGIPFERETLAWLGQKKASTHLGEGGSGIGYMTVFDILREFRASLIITEYEPKKYGFTKSVKVRFDDRDEYKVYTWALP